MEVKSTENSAFSLEIAKTAKGPYLEIKWFKGSRNNMIAIYKEGENMNEVLYTGDFCSGEEQCLGSSSKGELDTITGELTIYGVKLSDEDIYFYDFFTSSQNEDVNTGPGYQIKLAVYGERFSLNMTHTTCQQGLLTCANPLKFYLSL